MELNRFFRIFVFVCVSNKASVEKKEKWKLVQSNSTIFFPLDVYVFVRFMCAAGAASIFISPKYIQLRFKCPSVSKFAMNTVQRTHSGMWHLPGTQIIQYSYSMIRSDQYVPNDMKINVFDEWRAQRGQWLMFFFSVQMEIYSAWKQHRYTLSASILCGFDRIVCFVLARNTKYSKYRNGNKLTDAKLHSVQ